MNWGVFLVVLLTGWGLAALVQIAGQNRTTAMVSGGFLLISPLLAVLAGLGIA